MGRVEYLRMRISKVGDPGSKGGRLLSHNNEQRRAQGALVVGMARHTARLTIR
jgi:hypothetical protein